MSSPYSPKQRSEIYSEMTANILAFTPITSATLGEVLDNIAFAVADQTYVLYQETTNALGYLDLNNVTGAALDQEGSQFPNLAPRFQQSYATGTQDVTDPNITVHSTTVASGGATHGTTFLNAVSTSGFPSSGTLLVGIRNSVSYETWNYTGITGNQFTSSQPLEFDHGSEEPVLLHTVGDRTFPGPFTVSTAASPQAPAQYYTSTSPLVILDGEATGSMSIQAQTIGLAGNTEAGTITQFSGAAPFVGATTTNPEGLSNGQPKESDANFRARIKLARQALSTANVDAVTSVLYNVNNNGQIVRFVQVFEDPDPTLPSIIYIDDGTGFTPTQSSISDPIVLSYSAVGGEDHFYISFDNLPIVTLPGENDAKVFSNITLQKNGVTLSQGDSAGQYRVQPDNGNIKLITPLNSGDQLKITALTYYTGLVNLANKSVYGDPNDRSNFPGVSALGSWIQIQVPTVQFISIQGTIILDGSQPLSTVISNIQQAFLNYVKSLGVGAPVIVSRLVSLAFVPGVLDFSLAVPSSNIVIEPGNLAKVALGNITLA